MIPYVRYVLWRGAELACTALRLSRRSTGRHVRVLAPDEPWLPPTPAPVLEPLPEWKPRVPRYLPAPVIQSEWLSRRYAELYQWVAEMETAILESDRRAGCRV